MSDSIAIVTYLVRDYDEAIRYFTSALGFRLLEDAPRPDGKRWVVVAPVGSRGASLLLAKASTPDQKARIGSQTGGRVGFFLHTTDFRTAHEAMLERGVRFVEAPRTEAYGTVAVFEDLYGNRWDLLELRAAPREMSLAGSPSACSIRLYEDRDVPELQSAVQESLADLTPWMLWAHAGYSLEEGSQWVTAQADLARQAHAYQFAIFGPDGRYLGGCGINQINDVNRFANLGYWVRTSAAGRGFAPAAARLVAEYAFERTNLLRLEIVCALANARSQRVAEKLGAVREGVLRNRLMLPSGPSDAVMYSLLRAT